jgi:hypothetical protein
MQFRSRQNSLRSNHLNHFEAENKFTFDLDRDKDIEKKINFNLNLLDSTSIASRMKRDE